MMADEVPLTVDQGSRLLHVWDVTGQDLTGWSARGMVRPDKVSSAVNADWSSYLTVNAVNHQVVLLVTGDVTSAYTWDVGRYDIEIYKVGDPTSPIRISQGEVRLDREVTR
jgi:hypothetical protein